MTEERRTWCEGSACLTVCFAATSLQDFKGLAKKMESAGLVTFKPHYLLWVCQYGADAEECKMQCIRNGAYCCPDPDDDIHEGYSGKEVLLVSCINICHHRGYRMQRQLWYRVLCGEASTNRATTSAALLLALPGLARLLCRSRCQLIVLPGQQ